ncbi:helix-turn-helix domain-containing protein [Gordonia polyisoprenivorans]|uniref:helix-turn-helix domain-containing protein n=1 Tax=Gordonia polyisoprenivorans TaxID=84595 RepID=UPI001FCC2D81|nr:helix-turn-helix domain-containing protein [Gordonia polyisoprenivorans]
MCALNGGVRISELPEDRRSGLIAELPRFPTVDDVSRYAVPVAESDESTGIDQAVAVQTAGAGDEPLIRNQSGIARDRPTDQSVEELELETAIAANVRRLRQQQGLTVGDMAVRVGISKAMLSKIENAQTSCSLSTLARLATAFDVAVTSLFRGADVERSAVYVKAGEGSRIVRSGSKEGHEYELLGSLRGEHKRLECLLVTLNEDSITQPLFQHPGTEFLYMLDGVMDYAHGRSVYRLAPGDSMQLDGEAPHGPVALIELPIRFLSVIAFPDSAV